VRRARGLVAVVLIIGGIGVAFAPDAPAADAPSGSAVTVSGTGPFASLKVTVSQTTELINQTITVSWTGGAPTEPTTGQFGVNYLQIMQCWGDDPQGPDRSQCMYGGSNTQTTPVAGNWVRTRQVNYAGLVDPKEPFKQPQGSRDNVFVPFWAVGTDRPAGQTSSGLSDFIDAQLTNEIPLARSRGDGTGLEFFEVQTARQSPGLGCGGPLADNSPRACWLVIVPRGRSEVDGSDQSDRGLQSSPLSQSNWNNRIAVKLAFQPVRSACPLGGAERRLVGHELVVEAVGRWQPALCANGGTLFSLTQLSDDVARNQLLQADNPALSMLSDPVAPDLQLPERPLVYAPVALSGLAIGFFIEKQVSPDASDTDRQTDGVRFTDLKLNQRLVAKLLTQSYKSAVVGHSDYLGTNPNGLADDPEFLDLNPEYRDVQVWTPIADALVALGTADANDLLWRWVISDSSARAFLAGTPDEHGMIVNRNNKALTFPVPTFPRNDQNCFDDDPRFHVCTLDVHAFANNMHEAARGASRGDTLGRTASGQPNPDGTPKLTRLDRQAPGRRGILAVVDAGSAARYGLSFAKLRNASGQFVGPDPNNLQAAARTMNQSAVAGVLSANPSSTDPAAYPLTTLTYAAAAPAAITADAGRDYATFLRYAVGDGQQPGIQPGQLPDGYAPLPDSLKNQALAAATTIEQTAGKPVSAATPTEAGVPPAANSPVQQANPPAAAPPGAAPAAAPAAAPPASAPAGGPASITQTPVAQVRRTPDTPVGAIRYALVILLIGGTVAAASAPILHLLTPLPAGSGDPKPAAPDGEEETDSDENPGG
jgi:hypothetical protein